MGSNLGGNEADRGVGIGLAEQFLAFETIGGRIGKAVEADRAGSEEISLFSKLFLGRLVHLPALLDLVHQLVLLALLVLAVFALSALTKVGSEMSAANVYQTQARQNASLALTIALGELQRDARRPRNERREVGQESVGLLELRRVGRTLRIVASVAERGVDLHTAGLPALDALWDEVKRQDG